MTNKRKLLMLLGGVLLAVGVFLLIYSAVSNKLVRYSTPQEAFQKSAPSGAEMLDILEAENAAFVIYKDGNRIDYDTVMIKDAWGWPSISANLLETKTVSIENGVVSYWCVQDMNVLKVVVVDTTGEYEFSLSDNYGTQTLTGCTSNDDITVYYGLLVVEGTLPDNYTLFVGSEAVTV